MAWALAVAMAVPMADQPNLKAWWGVIDWLPTMLRPNPGHPTETLGAKWAKWPSVLLAAFLHKRLCHYMSQRTMDASQVR